jgi:hypothetical protein
MLHSSLDAVARGHSAASIDRLMHANNTFLRVNG